ncbi:SDR family NAD(P)-dependent oxidoreductase [Aggregatilinea lenta]|uniref:SDR family NAD(P)-dependent oxidoreductase n=1 Tax=Aggregatilinea lenta TaxID=913108 RepID=UPI000E5A783A|nr:SDR family oxidoreductase [Aggregatilinea lenta]
MAFTLEHDTALITGGGTGLGLGIARCFVEAGAHVIIAGRREDPLRTAVEELGPRASYAILDVTDLDGMEQVAAQIVAQHGEISILVNNAGIHLKKPAEDTTPAELQTVLDTHVLGAFALSRALIPSMKRHGSGHILFIASMASLMGLPEVVAYAAAKTAILGLMRTMAVELAPARIRVNAIAPGWIESPMMHGALEQDPARKERILSRTPMAGFGQPEDVGWAAVYLSAPEARFVTGTLLTVDGGISIGL